jgi:hypothetical protein
MANAEQVIDYPDHRGRAQMVNEPRAWASLLKAPREI